MSKGPKHQKWRGTKKLIETLWYLGLLAGGLAFCWKSIEDYIEKNTAYTFTQEPLSQEDIPTLIFCWELDPNANSMGGYLADCGLKYGADFDVDVRMKTGKENYTTTLK